MKIGAALILLAVGAILRFAIAAVYTDGVDLRTVGDILMLVGVLGLVLWAIIWAPWTRRTRPPYPPGGPLEEEHRTSVYRTDDRY